MGEKAEKISKMSQSDFDRLFEEKGTVIVEDMENYSNEEMFSSVIVIFQKIVVFGSKNPTIRNKTRQILADAKIEGHDTWGELNCVIDWIKNNVIYRQDGKNIEQLQSPEKTILSMNGDCDCLSILGASMLRSLGMQAGCALTNSSGGDSVDHALTCVSFEKDIVREYGVRSSSGQLQKLPKNLISKIPVESLVPLGIIKGDGVLPNGDVVKRWLLCETTEKNYPIGWCPPKSSFICIITPEFVSRIEIEPKIKGN